MYCENCKKEIKTVSNDQRGWYWAGIIPFLQTLVPQWKGLTTNQVHEVLKTEFNGFTIEDKFGNKRKYGQSISSNQVGNKKFDQYLLRIAEWVRNNYALEIPEPDAPIT